MEKLALKKQDNNILEMNYASALADDDFKEVVDKLKVSPSVKMKFTTKLKEATKEYKNCKNCKALVACKNQMKGYKLTPFDTNQGLSFSYVKCHFKEELEKKIAYSKNVNFFEIPPILKTASFKNIYKDDKNRLEIIKKIKAFYDSYKDKKEGKGIYLTGSFGSGKTYLLAALFNELAKIGVHSTIIYFPEFLRRLKAGFGDNEEYNDLFNSVREAPLLLIDDIGAERLTDWARDEILGTILQYRMEYKLPTFFTSNYNKKELEEHLQINNSAYNKVSARRIMERINFLSDEVTLIGVNRRSGE